MHALLPPLEYTCWAQPSLSIPIIMDIAHQRWVVLTSSGMTQVYATLSILPNTALVKSCVELYPPISRVLTLLRIVSTENTRHLISVGTYPSLMTS